ncbi:TonB family protein [Roseovarius sp.]|uniref:energy transducer TonB family protein n=1 Tax=Roseovarius sp. TaxID=1486281 RepID=UPI003BA8505A
MTASSRLAKTLAAATALTVHGLALWAITPDIEIEMEGSGGAMQASLGNAFSDMVEGTVSPARTEELTEPDEPEAQAEPTEAETTEADQTEELTEETPTGETAQDQPEEAREAETPEQQTAETTPEETRPDAPRPVAQDTPDQPQEADRADTATAPEVPDVAADVAVAQDAETPEPETLRQTAPDEVQPSEPRETPLAALEPTRPELTLAEPVTPSTLADSAETIEADPETSPAVSRSLRPQTRPRAIEEEQERLARQREQERQERQAEQRRQQQQQQQQAARQQPQGNASQNATTGAATGAETTRQQANTGTGRSAQSGNAAASNYPGQVMRQISRVRRPQVGSRGTAVVAFTISPSGGLSGLSLARSSGNGRLDQAALGVVRRAAPFPAPPPGARRSFSINIKGG